MKYTNIVRPKMKYAFLVLSPNLKKGIEMLEKVEKNAGEGTEECNENGTSIE